MIAVITSINPPTNSVRSLAKKVHEAGGTTIVVGDEQSPKEYDCPDVTFVPVDQQGEFHISDMLPSRNYAVKNIGYLMAFKEKAPVIVDGDDDTYFDDTWKPKELSVKAVDAFGDKFINVYSWFSMDDLWPRGIPLNYVHSQWNTTDVLIEDDAPIQQCLVHKQPDLDAINRLLYGKDVRFHKRDSVRVYSYTPFNSQNTWHWPIAYPLMYLPSYCPMRCSDIYRGWIAQRILHHMGYGVVFHQADAVQDRNKHNLVDDFRQEVELHLYGERMIDILDGVELTDDIYYNLQKCYNTLIEAGIISEMEERLVEAWIKDCRDLL